MGNMLEIEIEIFQLITLKQNAMFFIWFGFLFDLWVSQS
jgi:hypothetical protein